MDDQGDSLCQPDGVKFHRARFPWGLSASREISRGGTVRLVTDIHTGQILLSARHQYQALIPD